MSMFAKKEDTKSRSKKPSSKDKKKERKPHDDDAARIKEEAKKLREQKEKEKAALEAQKAAEAERRKEEERRAKELAKRKQLEDELFGESIEVEMAALDGAKADSSDSPKAHQELYELFPPTVYSAYSKLQEYARDLNTAVAAPEIVFVGRKGDGKSALIDAVFGQQFNLIGFGATARPLFFSVVNAADAETPRITIKRDAAIPEFDHDMAVASHELAKHIEQRNRDFTTKPIYVLYESNVVLNMTLIDTPGLDEKNPKAEALVASLIKPSNRTIVAVETTKEFADMKILEFVKKSDPELSRTVFAFSKFNQFLQGFNNSRTLNRFLSLSYPDVKMYFTSLPTSRVACDGTDDYRRRVYQAFRRDMNLLEQLQYDKRYERTFGVHGLRKHLFKSTWKNYQDSIPKVLKELRAKTTQTDKELKRTQSELKELDGAKLRSIASNYVVEFLQTVDRLIQGTSEANPTATGQTLKEEKTDFGDDEWLDMQNRPIRFDPQEYKIPYWSCKIYGGQQFERLLAEFRSVCVHTDIANVTLDDVATSAGINKLNNIPNFGWAASDLAAQKSQDAFMPLIEQLADRAVYIVKRLATLADSVMLQRAKKTVNNVHSPDQYPYFIHHVKDLFYKFVDRVAKDCKQKCLDEFYSSRTIYWHLSEYGERKLPMDRADQEDARKAVVELSKELFNELRERITKNVLLKWYNFFLVPLQTELQSELQRHITTLSDASLEQLFHLKESQNRLQVQERRLQDRMGRLSSQDAKFLEAASAFAHPVTNAPVAAPAVPELPDQPQ